MKKIALKIVLVLSVFSVVSCDKDYNTIGSDVIGDGHFDLSVKKDVSLVAYTKATGAVQSNNLPVNTLGFYSDGFFGGSKSTFVTQLELGSVAPDFGIEIDIQANDSVYLYVPYYTKQNATGSGIEPNTYEFLKSTVFGNVETASLDLKIFENKYYLRSFDAADPSVSQKYYSDQKSLVENLIGANPHLNDGANAAENTAFQFKDDEIIIYKTNSTGAWLDSDGAVTTDLTKRVVKERIAPGMWINLNKTFFKDRILNASDADLVNNNVFKEYLKGLYFQVNDNGNSNVMAMLDFSKAYINIQYHSKAVLTTDELKKKNFRLNLKGNTVNFFENTPTTVYLNAISSPNTTIGDSFLYPKGGDGSVVFIDLFGEDANGDSTPDELQQLRDEKILINDAFLTFTIENSGQKNPTRIFLYDATNNIPILDYIFDSSTATDPENNKFFYGGILVTENNVDTKYKIKLSSHINRLIRGTDSNTNKNVRLGLSVTQNINNGNRYGIKNAFMGTTNKNVPIGSIMSPLGTVLYGGLPSIDEGKRLKFEIYYTKAN